MSGDVITVVSDVGPQGPQGIQGYTGPPGDASQVGVTPIGAVANGIADDTAVIQACFDAARDAGRPWLIPGGTYRVTSVTAYTSGTCHGTLVSANDSGLGAVFTVDNLTADVATIPAAEVQGWGTLTRGQTKIPALANRRGQYVYLDSSEHKLIVRKGSATEFRIGEGWLVTQNDGEIGPAIMCPNWPAMASLDGAMLIAKAITVRHHVEITGLTIRLTGTAVGSRAKIVEVKRPNTSISGASLFNDSTGAVQQGFLNSYTWGVTYRDCVVGALGSDVTNYGFNSELSCNTTIDNCATFNVRRSVDNHRSKDCNVTGCFLSEGVGGHYVAGLRVENCHITGQSDTALEHVMAYTGGNVSYRNNRIYTSTVKNITGIRGDAFEAYGTFIFENNLVVADDSAGVFSADSNGVVIFYAGGPANASAYDPGRNTYLPDIISIKGNVIQVKGAASTAVVTLVYTAPHTDAEWVSTIRHEGAIIVEGNAFEFENNATLVSATVPPVQLILWKTAQAVGAGYSVRVSDVPGLYVWSFAAATVVTADTRNDYDLTSTGSVNKFTYSYGAYRRALWRAVSVTASVPGAGAGYVAIGDEVLRTFDGRRLHDTGTVLQVLGTDGGLVTQFTQTTGAVNYFNVTSALTGVGPVLQATGSDSAVPINIQTKSNGQFNFKSHAGSNQQFAIASTGSAVNYPYVAGSATGNAVTVGATGTDAAVDLQFLPKGAGRVRFGTLTANADAAITGYIEIKDQAGNTRKLAVIS